MNLIVDIGNSRAKLAIIDGKDTVYQHVFEDITADVVMDIVGRYPAIDKAIVASTRANAEAVAKILKESIGNTLVFDPATTPIPLGNSYHTPHRLGADRLAAAVGVATLYPNRDAMIVDFGTAITIDYVIGATFCGGNISPGVTTRFRALADYTASLPLCSPTEEVLEYGRTTHEAIEQGVMRGVEQEISGYAERFFIKNERNCIIFTGGDAKYFVKRIKNAIFADCEPVIFGLNRILEYNAEEL